MPFFFSAVLGDLGERGDVAGEVALEDFFLEFSGDGDREVGGEGEAPTLSLLPLTAPNISSLSSRTSLSNERT